MSDAKICDQPGCGAVIKGEQVIEHHQIEDGSTLKITLDPKRDWCQECSRRRLAKAARQAWDDLKQKRKVK